MATPSRLATLQNQRALIHTIRQQNIHQRATILRQQDWIECQQEQFDLLAAENADLQERLAAVLTMQERRPLRLVRGGA